jgi:hypothetical protein
MEPNRIETPAAGPSASWPVLWSAIFVGTLTALALVVVFGLVGLALGAHVSGPSRVVLDWKTLAWSGLALSVFGSFLAFVAGGWVAGRIAGFVRSEPAMLHGAIVWLIAVPMLLTLASHGAGNYLGNWYAGLAPNHPAWAEPKAMPADNGNAVDDRGTTQPRAAHDTDAAKATRNAALGAVAALLLGLMGAVIGGWMASGEPMTFTHWHQREGNAVLRG